MWYYVAITCTLPDTHSYSQLLSPPLSTINNRVLFLLIIFTCCREHYIYDEYFDYDDYPYYYDPGIVAVFHTNCSGHETRFSSCAIMLSDANHTCSHRADVILSCCKKFNLLFNCMQLHRYMTELGNSSYVYNSLCADISEILYKKHACC